MNGKLTIVSDSVEQTEAVAADLARCFVGGEIVALHGELGAGKTQFVRGMLRGLEGEPRSVSSPTFVLLNVYGSGRLALYHLDAYRIVGSEDFEAIGFGELLEQGGVVAVEWPERVLSLLPPNTRHVWITALDENRREIEIVQPIG